MLKEEDSLSIRNSYRALSYTLSLINEDIMIDAILDAVIDSLKLLPFLFITYLLMEYMEEKLGDKSKAALKKAGNVGPLWGSVLGIFPQCGFSVTASSMYAGRVITMGTLIAVFLSTSDEMLPILISETVSPVIIGKILAIKVFIAMLAGFAVDIVLRVVLHKKEEEVDIHHFCEHEHCSCGQGILKPAIRHTLSIFAFILIVTAVLNIVIELVGFDVLGNTVFSVPVVGELIAGLVGLIPNCGASVVITTLYLNGVLGFGTTMCGLLVNSGVGILVLFRVNEDRKNNITILGIIYLVGVIAGLILDLFGVAV